MPPNQERYLHLKRCATGPEKNVVDHSPAAAMGTHVGMTVAPFKMRTPTPSPVIMGWENAARAKVMIDLLSVLRGSLE